MSEEQRYLRPSLNPNLLKNVRDNLRYFEETRIFELGKIYVRKPRTKELSKEKTKSKGQMEEKRMLAGLIARTLTEVSGMSKESSSQAEDFYRLKGVIDTLLNKMGISNIWYDGYQATSELSKVPIWQLKMAAEIKIDQTEVGFLGAISSKVLNDLKIKASIILFYLDFDLVSRLFSEEQIYQPVSRYPAAVRDLAVLVPRTAKVVDVLNKINVAGGILVKDVDLFDMYEGTELPEGRKNFAFHIIYQAQDHTLSSKEIDEVHNKIVKALEKDPDWQVRK